MKRVFCGSVTVLMSTIGLAECAIVLRTDSVNAQVVPDSTLGTQVNAIGTVFEINNGTRSGNNLFHSFSQFSIPRGGSAIFNNALDVQNIFSRVTGSQVSNLDGILKSQGSANLFLMNPNGIVFGPNAQLQLGGSLLGTTATGIKFADGIEFNTLNATSTLTPTVLSLNLPIGLQMGNNSGTIQVTAPGHQLTQSGSLPFNRSQTPPGLQVLPGKTLALMGAGIALVGGILQAPGGHLELGSVRAGTINLTTTDQGWSFDYASNNQFQDIGLAERSLLDVSGRGGSIQLRGQNILFSDSSIVLIEHTGAQRGGSLILNAAHSIRFWQSHPSPLSTRIETQAVGTGTTGDIQITAKNLSLQNGAMINTTSYTSGGAGAIRIHVADSIDLFGAIPGDTSTDISRIAATSYQGNSGDIVVNTKQLSLRDGGSIFSVTLGKGHSGNVNIKATDSIEILGVKPNILPS
jgi:filamentous hemagglutinin family protein